MQSKLFKILAIDDIPSNLKILVRALNEEFTIQVAYSGASGLALAQKNPPDLILLDIIMPDMDGYEVTQHLKNDPELKKIPIIFLTALEDKETEIKCLSLGAADFLTKPINVDIAKLRIKNLLERNEYLRELKQRESELLLAASVFANCNDGIMVTDSTNTIINVNDSFCRITGYKREEALGIKPNLLISNLHSSEFHDELWKTLLTDHKWSGEFSNVHKNGHLYVVLASISAVQDTQGELLHFIFLFSDITDIKNQQHELERIAHFDALTGIPNRILMGDRLNQAMSNTLRNENQMAVCYLDLDGFKDINDRYGHDAGDHLLVTIAKRITRCLRSGDTFARIGGDEFVLLLSGLQKDFIYEAFIERILSAVAEPVRFKEHVLKVSASIGFTVFPDDDVDAETLLRHADQAMYVAKQSGKNRFYRFNSDQDKLVLVRRKTLIQIESAIKNNEFSLYFQPKVNMRLGTVSGAEVLIRWQHPEKGLLTPVDFLTEINNSELAATLGEWVMSKTFSYLEQLHDQAIDISLSINVAPRHFMQTNFVERLKMHLSAYPKLRPDRLEMEILESASLSDIEKVATVMAECQKLGITFALDDFGTGSSSLTFLKLLPAETLKIDQSFIATMLTNPEDFAIVEAIIDLTRIFKRQVIAEGVETQQHGRELLKLGCDFAQGYGIAKPMPFPELTTLMNNWTLDRQSLFH